MKTLQKLLACSAIGLGLLASTAQAHVVGLGWTDIGGGLVRFDALHWHGAQTAASVASDYMTVDGINYYWTSVTNNTASMTGLDGALVNSSYSTYSGNTLTALGTYSGFDAAVDDWMHVTIALSSGPHTLTAPFGSNGLTSWTLDGSITTANFTVPDSGSILALFGLAVLGLARFARVSRKA